MEKRERFCNPTSEKHSEQSVHGDRKEWWLPGLKEVENMELSVGL